MDLTPRPKRGYRSAPEAGSSSHPSQLAASQLGDGCSGRGPFGVPSAERLPLLGMPPRSGASSGAAYGPPRDGSGGLHVHGPQRQQIYIVPASACRSAGRAASIRSPTEAVGT